MTDKQIVIFGGSGFLGRYVSQALLATGARVRIAVRNPLNAQFIKPMSCLGQTQFIACDISNPKHVAAAMQGCDIAVNLVGILKGDFQRYHVDGPRNIAQSAVHLGIDKLLHISAIGADLNSESAYGRSRAEGEQAILEHFPDATIVRPSIIFGREDNFLNQFAGMISKLPIVPVIGGNTKFQPVFAPDVAKAIEAIITGHDHAGKIYEIGGPEVITMRGLNEWIADAIGRDVAFFDMPDFASSAMATLTGWAPGAPITRDQFKMLGSDNVVRADKDGLKALGITATPLEIAKEEWLVKYRRNGRFFDSARA